MSIPLKHLIPNYSITKALSFAAEAHHLQFRKGTTVPYIFHPVSVARILAENKCKETVVLAGLLHDVVEDTKVTLEQVEQEFGKKVSELVWAVSEHNKKLSWKKRKEAYIQQAKENPIEALQIMCADKLDNLGQIHRDLEQNGEKVWTRFNAPKSEIQWYYESLLTIFHDRFTRPQDRTLTNELQFLFETVFNIQTQNNQKLQQT